MDDGGCLDGCFAGSDGDAARALYRCVRCDTCAALCGGACPG